MPPITISTSATFGGLFGPSFSFSLGLGLGLRLGAGKILLQLVGSGGMYRHLSEQF
jgi:hypothetical protein